MTVRLRVLRQKLKPSTAAKVRLPAKKVEPFYQSAAWIALCADLKRERWPILLATKGHCCEDPACTADHDRHTRIVFDHIREIRDAPHLRLDKANVMGRCWPSHTRKTAAERAKRYHGDQGEGGVNP